MLLRASGETTGKEFDLHAVTDGTAAATSGVAQAETLVAFAEAVVDQDEKTLANARARVLVELGPEALVDAAAVAANFERMVRIADSTGIPLDGFLEAMTAELQQELNLQRFGSAANTPRR
jgi:hypothetical protein